MRPLTLFFTILAAMALSSAGWADTPLLRHHVVVSAPKVTLGDVFQGAGEHADTVVANAPAPGRSIAYDGAWLRSVAQAYGLDWRPTGTETVQIERASRLITAGEIKAALIRALGSAREGPRHGSDTMSLSLDNETLRFEVSETATGPVTVADLRRLDDSGRFRAILRLPSAGDRPDDVQVSGQIHHMIEIPVLTERAAPGKVIRKRDIEWLSMRKEALDRRDIVDAEALIGKSPRRAIRAGEPVRHRDVQEPIIVKKGQMVTVRYVTDRMTLIAQGKAMEDGARREVIRILNLRSNSVIEGEVAGPSVADVITNKMSIGAGVAALN
ncbi:MAG: flagellar basal body P-ring formation chaperone FlgA [Alphaproteobacteria bacterium]